jgi:hypothetical protein
MEIFVSFIVILLRAQREMQRDVERSERCRGMVFGKGSEHKESRAL